MNPFQKKQESENHLNNPDKIDMTKKVYDKEMIMNTSMIDYISNIKTFTRNSAFKDLKESNLAIQKCWILNMKFSKPNVILQVVFFQTKKWVFFHRSALIHIEQSDATLRNSTKTISIVGPMAPPRSAD